MERNISMIAVSSGRRLVGVPNVEKRALVSISEVERGLGVVAETLLRNTAGKTRVKDLVTRLLGSIGRRLERRGQADTDCPGRPLSLDEAWAGGWYGRSRMLQEGVLNGSLNAARTRKPEPMNWDDRLD
jgi:hypothetical protein